MRVYVVETDAQGGLIHFAFQLAEALTENGNDTTLLTGTEYELSHLPHRCKVEPILRLWAPINPEAGLQTDPATRMLHRMRRGWRAVVLARAWEKLTRHLIARKPDLVIFSMIRFPFLEVFLRRLSRAGIPMIQICHEFDDREGATAVRSSGRSETARRMYAHFSRIIFLSADTRRNFEAQYSDLASKTALVAHGPELLFAPDEAAGDAVRSRYAIRLSDRIVLMFGGLRPSKGVPELLEAFAMTGRDTSTRLIIAGSPSREFAADQIRSRIAANDLAGRVTLDLRYLTMEELGALVQRADVTVFPYRSATASGALAVAQSLGRPVIVTRTGGLAEAVTDGETGLVVAPEDIEGLSAAIETLLAEPERAEAMAEAGRARLLSRHSWTAIAEEIMQTARAFSGQSGQ